VDDAKFGFQENFCKAMGNAFRLEIMQETGYNQANVSRHLAVLRKVGAVQYDRQGATFCYRLADP
jgi:DNA-binding transcriptional ArsR family regulator